MGRIECILFVPFHVIMDFVVAIRPCMDLVFDKDVSKWGEVAENVSVEIS
jgi:hypothetical protein